MELSAIRQFYGGRYRLIDDSAKDYVLVESDPVVGPLANAQDPVGVRAALRKVGVQRIIVKPVADGWDFEGLADLSRLVNNKGKSGGPSRPQCTQRDVEGRPGSAGASPSDGGLGGPFEAPHQEWRASRSVSSAAG